jgi:hypothetical protein
MVVKEELIWGETDDFVGFRHFDSWETDEYWDWARYGDHGGKREKNQPFCRFFMVFLYVFMLILPQEIVESGPDLTKALGCRLRRAGDCKARTRNVETNRNLVRCCTQYISQIS